MARSHSAYTGFLPKILCGLFLFLLLPVPPLTAQELPPDSTQRQRPDSLKRVQPPPGSLAGIGNLGQPIDTTSPLHSKQFRSTDAIYAGDLLWKASGIFLREIGEPGQPGQLVVDGVDSRGVALLIDGRPLNDPVFGTYNLYDIPAEYIDEVEVLRTSLSLASDGNAPGGVINFVSHQFNNVRPRTKIRFFQGPFEHILTDAMFAQNVSRGVNAMIGIQRHVNDGRFANAAFDSWNARARVRVNLSDRLNVWLSDVYSKSTIGLNNGIDPILSPSIYDEITAIVNDQLSYQISSRHDLTLGVVGNLLPDSASRSKALLYYSTLEREYSVGSGAGAPPSFTDLQQSAFWGLTLEQRLVVSPLEVQLTGQIRGRSVDRSHFLPDHSEQYVATSATATVRPVEWIRGEFSTRIERLRSTDRTSWGATVEAEISPWLVAIGEYSVTNRFPTIQELYWSDTAFARISTPSREQHTVTALGLRLQSKTSKLSLRAFTRKVDNPIIISRTRAVPGLPDLRLTVGSSAELAGASAEAQLQIWKLGLTGNLTWSEYRQNGSPLLLMPRVVSTAEVSFRDAFIGGSLDLHLAARLRAIGKHFGLQFVPRMLAYAQQTTVETGGFVMIDLYATAKIGDAVLTLSWENPLNIDAMVVPYYPLMNRNFRLGVNWTFSD